MQPTLNPLVEFRHRNWIKHNRNCTQMERTLALTVVYIAFIAVGSGSILHEAVAPRLVPYQVTYTNSLAPVLLSQPVGLTLNTGLPVSIVPSPAPVSEASLEEHGSIPSEKCKEEHSNAIAQEIASQHQESHLTKLIHLTSAPDVKLLSKGILQAPISVADLGTGSRLPAAISVTPLPAPKIEEESVPALDLKHLEGLTRDSFVVDENGKVQLQLPQEAAESHTTPSDGPLPEEKIEDKIPSPGDLKILESLAGGTINIDADGKLWLQTPPESQPQAAEPEAPLSSSDLKVLDDQTHSSIQIDTDIEGKVPLQATLISAGEELLTGEIHPPQPTAATVAVLSPELPTITETKVSTSKGVANVNVNVNVNVNGDGTGSASDSTAASEINAPLDTSHKYH